MSEQTLKEMRALLSERDLLKEAADVVSELKEFCGSAGVELVETAFPTVNLDALVEELEEWASFEDTFLSDEQTAKLAEFADRLKKIVRKGAAAAGHVVGAYQRGKDRIQKAKQGVKKFGQSVKKSFQSGVKAGRFGKPQKKPMKKPGAGKKPMKPGMKKPGKPGMKKPGMTKRPMGAKKKQRRFA